MNVKRIMVLSLFKKKLPSIKTISQYLSLIKFSHTIFAMPFAFIGFFLGYSEMVSDTISKPDFLRSLALKFILVILCMIFARSAAMAFNRFLDAYYDKLNPRTAQREIPAGIIKPENALTFVILNCIFFVACTFLINTICFYLSPVALFVILFYSYTKRFTPLCHLVLGLGLSLAPIGAYLALTGVFAWLPIFFSTIVIFWVSGFDILYALQDEDFDRTHQLKSIPVLLGRKNALRVARVFHAAAACIVIAIAILFLHSIYYYIAAFLFVSLLFYQHTLVKVNDISKVNMAFATTNGIASILFAVFVIFSIFSLKS